MDREGSNLPENQDNDSQISPSPSDQTTDDGASKGIRAIPEQRKDATVCSDCLPQPSNETPTEDSCIHSSPLQSSSDSKKSKFACQSASSQVHSKNTEDDRCAQCLLACLFCELLFLCKSLLNTTSCGGFNTCSCCAEDFENYSLTCCTDCEDLEESCVNSDCVGICSECCGLCFPS
ncbi:myoD family inhibitor domain-containing protein-like isoform X2 [Chiloscyllium plagiosum]|nr:myoD family inhibitor domain-containing protein-like isoform X2 [Chiloscyllium plagiosum]